MAGANDRVSILAVAFNRFNLGSSQKQKLIEEFKQDMIRLFFILLNCGLLVNCGCTSNPAGDKSNTSLKKSVGTSLNDISTFYNCKTKISLGKEVGTQNVQYIEIETRSSPTIDMYGKERLHLVASNMAKLFYDNSRQEEYDEIRVILTSNGEQYYYVCLKSDIEIANEHLELLNRVSRLMAMGQFEQVFSLMEKDVEEKLDKKEVIDFCTSLNQETGKIINIQFQGFLITNEEEGRVLYLSAIQHREKKDAPFSIAVLLEKDARNIKTIRFSL